MSDDYVVNEVKKSTSSYIATLLLCFFFGGFGVHRFYTGYIVIGIVQLLTAGGFGIWTLIDLISIALNKYKDAEGNELDAPNSGCGLLVLIIIISTFIVGGLRAVLHG